MQENRAFDHYYGTMKGVRGFNDRSAPLLPTKRSPFHQPLNQKDTDTYLLPFHLSFLNTSATCMPAPEMSYPSDIGIWNNGKMDSWNTARSPGFGMSYFTREDLPYYYKLSDYYLINDMYFQSTLTATNPNRLHLFSGSNGLSVNNTNMCIMDDTEPKSGVNWITMAEVLQNNNITWKVYQQMDNFDDNAFAWFDQFKKAKPGNPLYDNGLVRSVDLVQEFANDVGNRTLPQVSWIVGPSYLSEHAEYHPQDGEELSAQLINILGQPSNKEIYKKTVFILNYDEGGQFYDHLWIPTAPQTTTDGKSTVTTIGEVLLTKNDNVSPNNPIGPGFRVPFWIISPWTINKNGGIVFSELADHTSVLKFVEKRFNVYNPNISPWRRAVMSDLLNAFDFDNPDYDFPTDLPDTSNNTNESRYECNNLPYPVVPSFDEQYMPTQEKGTKLSRKLSYYFDIESNIINSNQINIKFINNGKNIAGVFHVYDYANMDNNPKKYTIESNKQLNDVWNTYTIQSKYLLYNLSIHGPNGYVRQFSGQSQNISLYSVKMIENNNNNTITLILTNYGTKQVSFTINDLAYGDISQTVKVSNTPVYVNKDISKNGNWYDYEIREIENNDVNEIFVRRYMGRMENGNDLITDPAMAVPTNDLMKGKHPKTENYFKQIPNKIVAKKKFCAHSEFVIKDMCYNYNV